MPRRRFYKKITSLALAVLWLNHILFVPALKAQPLPNLPTPATIVGLSSPFSPPVLKGLSIYPDRPLQFDFIVDKGKTSLQGQALKEETLKLIKYFLASLTVPEKDLWVNLSPYEKDRIVSPEFGQTEMGRDLLAQDYFLKQLSASLTYPDGDFGKTFWEKVYAQTGEKFGVTEIPINTFNKIWIIPDNAVVYEKDNTVFILESHLKVMLEEDYLIASNVGRGTRDVGRENQNKDNLKVTTQILREILIPAIKKEVNEGKNFANLRQIYQSMILAMWYKQNLKESLLAKIYADKGKVKGVDIDDKQAAEKIYQQYLTAFKQGVYHYIKEDYDPVTQQVNPRKYFSGGFTVPEEFRVKAANDYEVTQKHYREILVDNSKKIADGELYVANTLTEEPAVAIANVIHVDKAMLTDRFEQLNQDRVDEFNTEEGFKVVDMATGDGKFLVEYHKQNPEQLVIGFEIDKNRFSEYPKLNVVIRDARQTGIMAKTVDLVTINHPHPDEHPDVITGMFQEAWRILKPGGRLQLVVENPVPEFPSIPYDVKNAIKIHDFRGSILRRLEDLGFRRTEGSDTSLRWEPLSSDYPRSTVMLNFDYSPYQISLMKAMKPLADEKKETQFKDHAMLVDEARFPTTSAFVAAGLAAFKKLVNDDGLADDMRNQLKNLNTELAQKIFSVYIGTTPERWLDDLGETEYQSLVQAIEKNSNFKVIRHREENNYSLVNKQAALRVMKANQEFFQQEGRLDVPSADRNWFEKNPDQWWFKTGFPLRYGLLSGISPHAVQNWKHLQSANKKILEQESDFNREEIYELHRHDVRAIDGKRETNKIKTSLARIIKEHIPDLTELEINAYLNFSAAPILGKEKDSWAFSRADRQWNKTLQNFYDVAAREWKTRIGRDSAMTAESRILDEKFSNKEIFGAQTGEKAKAEYGGIDFNPAHLNLQIKRDGKGVPLPVSQQDVAHIQIEGLTPIIINIRPATFQNLPFLLSKVEDQPADLSYSSR